MNPKMPGGPERDHRFRMEQVEATLKVLRAQVAELETIVQDGLVAGGEPTEVVEGPNYGAGGAVSVSTEIPVALGDLSDVNAFPGTDGEALIWDTGTAKWVNGEPYVDHANIDNVSANQHHDEFHPQTQHSLVQQTVTDPTYNAAADDDLIYADASLNAIAVTLPTAVANEDYRYTVKKIDDTANIVTIDSAVTIDGEASKELWVQHESITVISDGTEWNII